MSLSLDDLGKKVRCPKCGEEGVVRVEAFTSRGRKYAYLVVRHDVVKNGKRRVKRCVISRLTEEVAPDQERGPGEPGVECLKLVYALYEFMKARDATRELLEGVSP